MIRPFAYLKPRSLEEALQALQAPNSRPLAGGTDLLVEMRGGSKRPELLVDIKGLQALGALEAAPGEGAVIGALATLNDVADHPAFGGALAAVGQGAFAIATHALRNRATLGGNLCNGSPAADTAPPLYVLDAQVVIAGPGGERRLPIASFLTGVKKIALRAGELVTRIEVPAAAGGKSAFLKKTRVRGHDLALVNAAGLANRKAGILRICVGACAVTPRLVPGTDELLRVHSDPDRLAEAAAELAADAVSPIDDVRAGAAYRRDMVRVLVRRLVRHICG
jgi:carbon-monoxide dehydrogenase medium subunit